MYGFPLCKDSWARTSGSGLMPAGFGESMERASQNGLLTRAGCADGRPCPLGWIRKVKGGYTQVRGLCVIP